MRCLVLFPPQWIPFSPHLAGPAIHSILRNNGHDVVLRDLNIEFYNSVLTPEYLYDAVKKAFADFEKNAGEFFQACPNEAALKQFPRKFQLQYRRYREILAMAQRNQYRDVILRISGKKQLVSPAAVL